MKKLLGIVVLSLLLSGSGNANAEIITFLKCAKERNNYKFDSSKFEKYELKFDTLAKTVTKIVVRTDKHAKETNEMKHFIRESKLDYMFDNLAGRTIRVDSKILFKIIYDLEKKTYESMDYGDKYKIHRNKCL